jgi:zinc transport system substrate-binding protein
LEKIKAVPFLVYHNAWQYFVKQNGLNMAEAVLFDEDSFPGIKRKLYLKNLVVEKGIKCLFVDAWLNDDKAAKLAADLGVKIKEADPLGANIKGGTPTTYYFTMIKDAAAAYKDCLEN